MYNIGFLLSNLVAPVQLLFPLLNSNLSGRLQDIYLNNEIENPNSDVIELMHDYSFAKDDTIYLNIQFNLKSSRGGNGALFRFSNHKVEIATQYFLIVNYVTGLNTIGFSDPTNQWLCTSSALEAGEYRALGTLKMH